MRTNEELIADLQRVAKEKGQHTCEAYKWAGHYTIKTYLNHFGSWNAAVQAAGLPVNQCGRKRKR